MAFREWDAEVMATIILEIPGVEVVHPRWVKLPEGIKRIQESIPETGEPFFFHVKEEWIKEIKDDA